MIAPRFRPARLALPLAAALLLTAGAALAQPDGYGGPPDDDFGPGDAPGYGAQPYGQRSGGPDLTRLHSALHITAAQEGAWRAFVAASAPDPQQQARERSAQAMLPKLTAPQRVDLSIAAAQADLDTLRAHGEALKAFYAALTPEQQKTFDRETQRRADEQGD
jgi:Spy/CpxP family protein refolding chaperone